MGRRVDVETGRSGCERSPYPSPRLAVCPSRFSGRSAARLARLVRDQEVGGSNPLAPTRRRPSLALDSVAGLSADKTVPPAHFAPLTAATPLRGLRPGTVGPRAAEPNGDRG